MQFTFTSSMDVASSVSEDEDIDESSFSSSNEEGYISSDATPVELQMLEAHSQTTSKSKGTFPYSLFAESLYLTLFRQKTGFGWNLD